MDYAQPTGEESIYTVTKTIGARQERPDNCSFFEYIECFRHRDCKGFFLDFGYFFY